MKFVVITGGVLSGIGKGVCTSSIGLLLRLSGIRITAIKIDPYLNVDAGTMSPLEHGEVFVMNDGGECDLDIGNYERWLDITLSSRHNITFGKVMSALLEKERRGDFLGKTVQIVPHLTDAIMQWIQDAALIPVDRLGHTPPEVCVIELGGTVGDIESAPFIEALRQLHWKLGSENFFHVHVSLVPILGGEHKTKPTQQSVQKIRALGLQPDLIICRSSAPVPLGTREKISMFCQVPPNSVLGCHDVNNMYFVPLSLCEQGMIETIASRLRIQLPHPPNLTRWTELANRTQRIEAESTPASAVHIAIVGKYCGLTDSYLSVLHALRHAALAIGIPLVIDWVDAAKIQAIYPTSPDSCAPESSPEVSLNALTPTPPSPHSPSLSSSTSSFSSSTSTSSSSASSSSSSSSIATLDAETLATLEKAHGILVPGGFGDRGIEIKIAAVNFARTHKKPFLGICLGMQIALVEFARAVLGKPLANSEEFNAQSPDPVVVFMPEISRTHMGGTMRLGSRRTWFCDAHRESSLVHRLYENPKHHCIDERHRHRYEANTKYLPQFEASGLKFVGRDETGTRMSIIEMDQSVHPFFIASQFHPEFLSHPEKPAPMFLGFVAAAAGIDIHSEKFSQVQKNKSK